MKEIKFQSLHFDKSAAQLKQLPEDSGKEIAVIGRSNAGKSSAINCIAQQKSLAKTSKTPGRTQLINVFNFSAEKYRLMDLPGYGFAKVPADIKNNWEKLIETYLQRRESLCALIMVMDCRHPLRDLDLQLLSWADSCQIPTHVLLTKSDKISRSSGKKTLLQVQKTISQEFHNCSVQLFSSLKRIGLDTAREKIISLFDS